MKKNYKDVLLIICILIVVILGAFILYDKVLKKKESCKCQEKECLCVKCTEKEEEVIYSASSLKTKYRNISDKESYISFDVSKETWEGYINECEGYGLIKGKYVDEENGIITLKYESGDVFGTLRMVNMDNSDNIVLLKEIPITNGDSASILITGCSGSPYFAIEK